MSLFCNRRPRPFSHRMIYSDERSERLKAIEKRAKRELGIIPPEESSPGIRHGVFLGELRHTARRRAGYGAAGLPLRVVLLTAALLACLYFLVTAM